MAYREDDPSHNYSVPAGARDDPVYMAVKRIFVHGNVAGGAETVFTDLDVACPAPLSRVRDLLDDIFCARRASCPSDDKSFSKDRG
jgi:hypothetical protein